MAITAEDLHRAADLVGSFGDDESRIEAWGLSFEALHEFIDGSDWKDVDASGPHRDLDPLALAIGISIGVIASQDHHKDEAFDEAREAEDAELLEEQGPS